MELLKYPFPLDPSEECLFPEKGEDRVIILCLLLPVEPMKGSGRTGDIKYDLRCRQIPPIH